MALTQNGVSKHDSRILTGIPEVPVTLQRKLPSQLDDKVRNPGLPRATKAVSREKPHGDPSTPDNRTVLQQHVLFWDRDGDGKIYPWDTYVGFRRIGFNPFLSAFAILVIHGTFSWPSQGTWLPDPLFSIKITNMHRTKHGSDSEVYDTEGRFVPEKFEEIFSKYDKDNKGGLTLEDMWHLSEGNRNVMDPTGWTAEKLEWGALWLCAADDKGFVSKEKIRGCFDGTLWPVLEREVLAKKNNKSKKA